MEFGILNRLFQHGSWQSLCDLATFNKMRVSNTTPNRGTVWFIGYVANYFFLFLYYLKPMFSVKLCHDSHPNFSIPVNR